MVGFMVFGNNSQILGLLTVWSVKLTSSRKLYVSKIIFLQIKTHTCSFINIRIHSFDNQGWRELADGPQIELFTLLQN